MKDGSDDMVVQRMAQLETLEAAIKKDIDAVVRAAEGFRIIREQRLCRNSQQKRPPRRTALLCVSVWVAYAKRRLAQPIIGRPNIASNAAPGAGMTGCSVSIAKVAKTVPPAAGK